MVGVTMRKRDGRDEYYLKYSSTGKSKEKYLGTKIPKDINLLKKDFEERSYREDKIPLLEAIQKKYSRRIKTTDPKILEGENHEFKIAYTYSTQRIEGSTMTLRQTRKLLEEKLSPKDTSTEDIVEAEQISEIFGDMLSTDKEISQRLILDWHQKLFERTDANNAGNFRREDVAPYLGKTEYAMWPDVISDVKELVGWHDKHRKRINPVELSARFHRWFEIIHPFIDGNGRIGRMLMLYILHKNGYPLLNILPKEKNTYIGRLESSYLKNDEMVFVKWFVSKYLRDWKRYL